ncbi:MAG: transcriptional regulator [Deltaproteobacteria bacterium]|nr:transcriptional regulator [Deltaproteobacteria bacterium]
MNAIYNKPQKTLGERSATFITLLQENGWNIFDVPKAASLLKLHGKEAAGFVDRLIERGLVTRLKGGLYQLVPFELGRESTYVGDPFIIMAELAASCMKEPEKYFISHGSAMELHQMVTQPQFKVFATVPKFLRSRNIHGTEFRFVTCKPDHFFGFEKDWRTKTKSILVSDIERTVLDGMKQPDYCGGIGEVAKGLWIKRTAIDIPKLIEYALKLESGAVYRRLGFLCSFYEIASEDSLKPLKSRLTSTYQLLDPSLPKEGPYTSSWKIQLNISEQELAALRNT